MVESKQNSAEDQKVKALSKDEIEKFEGEYDQDGFFKLKSGGFYDPLGYHYNKDGFDCVGGFYNEEGYYQAPDKTKPF